jgi:hypothetical protein
MPATGGCPTTAEAFTPTAGSAPATPPVTDEDGYVTIVDRVKDMIISGGENIYPAEVEDVAGRPPGGRRVRGDRRARREVGRGRPRRRRAAPRGRPLDPDEVLASLPDGSPSTRSPSRSWFADELPRTASGKLLKARASDTYQSKEQHMSITVNGLDELKKLAGSDLGTSDWIEITQERVNTFADATGDHQWIHVDEEKAKEGPFGAPIAHGYLTLSLLIPLFTELLDVEGVTTGQLRPEQGAVSHRSRSAPASAWSRS